MVTRAARHKGQRGIRTSLTSLVVSLVRLVASRTGGGRSVGADTLVAGAVGARAGMVAAPLESSGGVAGQATPPLDSTGRCVLTAAGRRDLCSTGAYLDALGGGLLHLGHHDLEHPVVERGLDLLGLDLGGQGDRAAEGAVAA